MIDNPYVIDRETVKLLLQINDTTYDTLIDLYLPIVSDDINIITNVDWVKSYTGDLTNASQDITNITYGDTAKGQLVSTENYTQAIITDLDTNTLTVDKTATATTEGATVLVNQFPIGKRVVAAQMIGYQISKNSGIGSTTQGSIKSKSLPPLSVTYNESDNSISNGYGYPNYMIKSLMLITRPRFK